MKKILLVDDHIHVLRLLALELKLEGYEVETALNGKEALRKIDCGNPDLVLLDIIMPEMNGFEMLSKLREYSSLPVIASSFDAHNKEQALKLGANDFVLKPFETCKLIKKINCLINRVKAG